MFQPLALRYSELVNGNPICSEEGLMLRSGVSLFLSALPAWPAICFRGIRLSQALGIFKFCNCLENTATFLTNEMEPQLQLGC